MSWVHKNFQLNDHVFSNSEEIIAFSKSVSKELHTFLTDWFNKNDYVIVTTSGSTGVPKNIQLKKEYMKNSALATGMFFETLENTKALCCLPVEFIAGKMMVVRALMLGWNLDVIDSNSNPLAYIEKTYDFSAMVPLQLRNSLDKLSFLKKLIVGGGVVSQELQEAIQEIPTAIYATYGMTETITHIAIKPINIVSGGVESSSYKVLPNVLISKDERNCLVIKAPKVSDEVIITNDVVDIVSETQFTWKGRYDNVINSGGIKLHPEEIEKKLSPYIQSKFFVAGIPDEILGEKLILVIEKTVTSNEVEKSLDVTIKNTSTLSKFEKPKEVFYLSEFLLTKTGKIKRKETLQKIPF